jgi:hypothetical protein
VTQIDHGVVPLYASSGCSGQTRRFLEQCLPTLGEITKTDYPYIRHNPHMP